LLSSENRFQQVAGRVEAVRAGSKKQVIGLMPRARAAYGFFLLLLALPLSPPIASSQEPAKPEPKPDAKPDATYQATPDSAAEMVTHDSAATFKVRVNLVLVRVVVRDDRGNVVDNLKKEDFQLFDNRKLQNISTFSVENPESHNIPIVSVDSAPPPPNGVERPAPVANLAQRFVTLLFDDLNLEMGDALTVRVASQKVLDSLAPGDRIAIFTTSGQVTQDFTFDREVLRTALEKITPHPLFNTSFHDCPDVTYYQADLIVNKSEQQALDVAAEDTVQCAFGGDESKLPLARQMASSTASRVLSQGDSNSEYAYRHMSDALRRLSGVPGQRKLVFISPGFILSSLFAERVDLIDRANRAGIVIDTVDARGLYTPDVNGDIASPSQGSFRTNGFKAGYLLAAQSEQGAILQDLSSGTGGTNYHNRNDLDVAIRQAIAAPPVSYLLGFSPQNLKLNGSFHNVKVSLAGKQKYSVQSRRGYYAPRAEKNPEEAARQEIQEAVFSQEEIRDLPVDLQTQFFRKDPTLVRLSVLAHFDLKGVKFRKVDGRNRDDVTFATVIFDENGNFVTGGQKILEMKLLDATLEKLGRNGVTVKSSFDVKPGSYLVRLVVRDKEGEMMAARNGAVVIPY
jgi:VWFA-related protein